MIKCYDDNSFDLILKNYTAKSEDEDSEMSKKSIEKNSQ